MFPRKAVGSVIGIGGAAGAVGGMFIAMLVGAILQATHSYVLIFVVAGSMYFLALAVLHALAPRLEPAPIQA
jgi:ACS family hexuronate transporter-like MFS transporter